MIAISVMHALLLATLAAPSAAPPPNGPHAPGQEEAGPGLRLVTPEACAGYTLIAPLSSRWTYLLDLQGRVVHRWESRFVPGNAVHLLEDGSILRCGRDEEAAAFTGGGQGGYVERIAWDGTVLWTLDWSDESHLQHHDALPLQNGNVILIAWERKTREEALSVGRDPRHVGDDGLWPDMLVEIEPVLPEGGRVVWEWHAWDHLIQDFDPKRALHGDVTAHPERIDVNADHRLEPPVSPAERRRREEEERRMRALGYVGDRSGDAPAEPGARWDRADWMHTNSVALHPEHDLLLLSVLRLSEIWVIDHSTTREEARGSRGGRRGRGGDLLYRWGNPRSYGAPGARALFAQHDAHWIPKGSPGAGRVLLFNNGGGRPLGDHSTVEELELPFDPERGFAFEPGRAFGPQAPTWRYGAPSGPSSFFSSFLSGAQRLPNGNTLICSGAEGRVFEVTPDARIVWDFRNSYGDDDAREARGPAAEDASPPASATAPEPEPEPEAVRGLFRATRIAPDHPALRGRELGAPSAGLDAPRDD